MATCAHAEVKETSGGQNCCQITYNTPYSDLASSPNGVGYDHSFLTSSHVYWVHMKEESSNNLHTHELYLLSKYVISHSKHLIPGFHILYVSFSL
jgi:hypothetical protein